jgi:hypothetical protein
VQSASVFPAWAGPAERLRHLLRYAVLVPSRHNSQPWLFEIDGEDLWILSDRRRALPAADPDGREMRMACGAVLENVRIAAAHHGHLTDVEVLGGDRTGDLVARVRLGERRAPDPAGETLFAAIPRRRTALAIAGADLDEGEARALSAEAAREGALLRAVPRQMARLVAELVAEADAVQWASARYRSEHAAWTRPTRRPGALPPEPRPAPAASLRRLLWGLGRARPPAEIARRCAEQTRGLLVLATPGDGPVDWIAAGRAMQRVLLRAAAMGMQASYVNQPIEVADARGRLRRALWMREWPQLLFRVGEGRVPRLQPRRPLELVLRSFSAGVTVEVEPGEAVAG